MNKTGRNDFCPCGSGRKYKVCCLRSRAPSSVARSAYDRAGTPANRSTGGSVSPAALIERAYEHIRWLRPSEAIPLIQCAIAADSTLVSARVALGIALKALDRIDDAEAAFREALRLDVRAAVAHHNLGELHRRRHRLQQASESFEAALQIDPGATPSRVALGHVLVEQGEFQRAADCYRLALAASPPSGAIYKGLGFALRKLGERTAAIEAYRQVARYDPPCLEIQCELAAMLLESGEHKQAAIAALEATRLDPDSSRARTLRATAVAAQGDLDGAAALLMTRAGPGMTPGRCLSLVANQLYGAGHISQAHEAYRRVLEIEPDNPFALHFIAAWNQRSSDHPPAGYVEELFDGYASYFDNHLVSDLKYAVPREIRDALLSVAHPVTPWDVLDLGCGTGLVGEAIAIHARELVGVDLSAKMLERARERNCYTRLLRSDLSAALAAEAACNHDVVTAGDVFIYVGNLDRVIPSIRRVLRTGGVFAFTVEAAEDGPALGAANDTGYLLRTSGRYAHSAQYLEKLAAAHDFHVQLWRRISLRLKGDGPGSMIGWLGVWRATAPRLP